MRKLSKIICIFVLIFMVINNVLPSICFASNNVVNKDPLKGLLDSSVVGGFLRIVLIAVKILLLVPGVLINLILSTAASASGKIEQVTLYKLFFNQISITNINIFDMTNVNGAMIRIRDSIASLYVAFRNLAIVFSLGVLIYIGIQMAINNIAESRAKYKQMLVNWLVGFGLIFVLHYIIIFTINANEYLITLLKPNNEVVVDFTPLLRASWNLSSLTISFGATIMYSVLLVMTFIFFIVYLKRLLTVSFLILIAPLICITYSIDKIDNNKSEILDTWLKEFMYNILVQPFHCIIYIVLIGTAMNLLNNSVSGLDFGAIMFAVILTSSIFLAQRIIREIFGFNKSSSLLEKIATVSVATSAISTIRSVSTMKKSKNDKQAERRVNELQQKMPDGTKTNAEDLVRYRKLHEKITQSEENASRSSTKAGTYTSSNKAKQKAKRPLKYIHPSARRLIRGYTGLLSKFSGHSFTKEIVKNMRRPDVLKMTDKDYLIAASECFRQSQDSSMSNEELAKRMEQIYNEKNLNNLDEKELNFKMIIEDVKTKIGKQEMIDAIKYGTNENARWNR